MQNNKIILLVGVLLVIAGAIGFFLIERDEQKPAETQGIKKTNVEKQLKTVTNSPKPEKKDNYVKADLYPDNPYIMPLASIVETADLPANTKHTIDKVLEESQGCYLLKQNPDTKEVFIILQNPVEDIGAKYPRHNMQIAQVKPDGQVEYINLGFTGEENEIQNAVLKSKTEDWEFDKTTEPKRPIKHTLYDKKKNVLFSEIWNYDDSEPIKYEMKDSKNNTVSVLKESVSGDSGYRQEHVFYDENGHIRKSITASYEGADIKWFTYYDSENPYQNVTIESEYSDGLKSVEKVYNQEFQLEKTLTASYTDGERSGLKVMDSGGTEIANYGNQ